ncbi:acyl carrier protein [Thiomonas sp.]|uniref:acyl carrier protein n=1 Tax=Thiomonas sp. TaxID=2047785 RepID=UPI002604533D|nr:acyl carrier protein [Thiomonas sp.]
MEHSELLSRVVDALAHEVKADPGERFEAAMSLRDDVGLDSMSILTFLMSLEDRIAGFTVDAETLENRHVQTIGSICQYVAEQLARERSHAARR